jgi:ABC-type bacteriocin/lantibiotic exporter with double-glycine peptidase domain
MVKIFLYFLMFVAVVTLLPIVIAALILVSPFMTIYFVIDRILTHNELKKGLTKKEEEKNVLGDIFNSYMNERAKQGI